MSTAGEAARPSTGKGSRRYERYEAQDLDVAGKRRSKKMGVNDANRGYSDSDTAAEKAERAQVAYEATVRGFASEEPEGTAAEREYERVKANLNHGVPEHRGFSKKDRARMEKALKADAKAHDE